MTTPNNTTLPQGPYTYNSGITGTDPFITVFSLRNPLTSDVNYPIQKRWINFTTTPPSEWILESISVVQQTQSAVWKLLSGPGSGTVLGFIVPLGSSPVFPDNSGFVTYTSSGGTVLITGSTNTINFDVVGGAAPVQRFQTDDGLFETPTGSPGTIIIHGTGGITTSQGTAHQININLGASGVVEKITGDDTVIVTPDSGGNINLFGNVVANATHAKAVFTHSPVAHEEQIDVQVAAAIASTDITKVGLAAFNNTQFTVDANGFVAMVGGGGAFNAINVQVFTSSGTYTPTANMAYCTVECVGGGGGGGSTANTAGGQCAAGAGGNGGGYTRKTFNAATIGVSQTVTIGAAGSAGTAGGGGGGGGTTTFGALLTSTGGNGGNGCPSGTQNIIGTGPGGSGSGGDVNTGGGIGSAGISFNPFANGGSGGSSFFGGGGNFATTNGTAITGVTATSYGGGGGGAAAGNSQSSANGGAGAKGVVVVTEFIT